MGHLAEIKTLTRFVVTIGAGAFFAGCGGSLPPMIAPSVSSDTGDALLYHQVFEHHRTFKYTGSEQTFEVPSGVTSIFVDARGAAGAGSYTSYYGGGAGGRGGRVRAAIRVKAGQRLHVFVGGQGFNDKGGFNGGGDGGAGVGCYGGWGGGGASDVRENGETLSDRILVAGGGGGLGDDLNGYKPGGGSGGGKRGGNGNSQASGGGGGGGGGTQSKGGARGSAGPKASRHWHGHPGRRGELGAGGTGGPCGHTHYAGGSGGGGGGGYFGGGGGGAPLSAGGAGGGGSGYVEQDAIKSRMWNGWKRATGDGIVVFSW